MAGLFLPFSANNKRLKGVKKLRWILIGCFVLLALIIVIIFTKLKVSINYSHFKDNDSLIIEFRALFGLIKYKLNVPLIKIDDDSPTIVVKSKAQSGNEDNTKNKSTKQISAEDVLNKLKDFKTILEHVVQFHRIIRHFLRKVKITKFEWKTKIGTGDAAHTGMLTGAAWTLKGSILALISHYFRLQENPNIFVEPHFQMAVIQTSFRCMFQFRIGHAILAGIKFVKYWKGGRPSFRTKQLAALTNNKTKSV